MIRYDELHDAGLFLDRRTLVAMSLTCCRFSVAVACLPPNVCLLRIREVVFAMMPERPERATSRYRSLGDNGAIGPLEYHLRFRFDDCSAEKKITEIACVYDDPQTVLEILKHTLRTVSALWVTLYVNTSLFDASQLKQSDVVRGGIAGILALIVDDISNVEPSVFEVSFLLHT